MIYVTCKRNLAIYLGWLSSSSDTGTRICGVKGRVVEGRVVEGKGKVVPVLIFS